MTHLNFCINLTKDEYKIINNINYIILYIYISSVKSIQYIKLTNTFIFHSFISESPF